MLSVLVFWLLAFLAIFGAFCVVLHKNPMRSAMFLVLTMVVLALLFLHLHAYLMAMLQILVYAGAVMVLFIFVIMLLGLGDSQESFNRFHIGVVLAVVLMLMGGLAYSIGAPEQMNVYSYPKIPPGMAPDQAVTAQGLANVARQFYTRQVFAIEMSALLLVAAMVGVAVMGRSLRERKPEGRDGEAPHV